MTDKYTTDQLIQMSRHCLHLGTQDAAVDTLVRRVCERTGASPGRLWAWLTYMAEQRHSNDKGDPAADAFRAAFERVFPEGFAFTEERGFRPFHFRPSE